jgi:transcription elongation factor Elf1
VREELLATKHFSCPHCGERISAVLDLSATHQSYVEDCEVCCRPIRIRFTAEEGRVVFFEASLD